MHALLFREAQLSTNREWEVSTGFTSKKQLNGKKTCGHRLLSKEQAVSKSFSTALREMIAECLMFEPSDRPDIVSLQVCFNI